MSEILVNEIMLTLLDAERALHDAVPTSVTDVVLAALTAEPETLEELESAMTRYYPSLQQNFLPRLQTGINETKWDAGLLIVDLPARLIVADIEPALYEVTPLNFTAFECTPPAWVHVPEDEGVGIRYRLSEDWLIINSLANWGELAAERRRERAANPPFDARPVLFGQVAEFIARECLAARDAGHADPVVEIHERWLLTPRADLRGQTPREVLLARHSFVDYDLDSRAMQWAFSDACPPALNPASTAYRCSPFGTHSFVVYFDLLRYLLNQCWERVRDDKSVSLVEEIARLEKLQSAWLAEGGDYGHGPGWILEQERRRIPITATSEEMLLDHDCEICQMEASHPEWGPGFWHLDGSEMAEEDNWVFSFHATRADWEAEQRKWEEFNRKFAQEQAELQAENEWAAGEQIHDDRKSKADEEADEIPF
jgi:hypothetical protein